jgi:hypothetical protein
MRGGATVKTRTKEEKAAKRARREYVLGRPLEIEAPKVYELKRNQGLNPKGERGKRYSVDDREASRLCKELAGFECTHKDGDCWGELEAHHVIGRDDDDVRLDQENLVCLCWWHHREWAHKKRRQFLAWFDEYRPGAFRSLQIKANHNGREAVE